MYTKVVGVVRVRNMYNPYLFDVFSELSVICEKILVDDRDNLLKDRQKDMILNLADADIYKSDQYDVSMYSPDWVLALYDDEATTKRFRFMKDSICSNPHINIWEAHMLPLWDSEDKYRTDKLWGDQYFPILYRWIPEIDYKFNNGDLVPSNQPGPREHSGEHILSYRYLTREQRMSVYAEYLPDIDDLNYITNLHYHSLMDQDVSLERLVD